MGIENLDWRGETNLNILFCGCYVPEEIEQREQYISAAGNRFQNNVIRNLKMLGHAVLEFSYIGMPVSGDTENALEMENERLQTRNFFLRRKGFLRQIFLIYKQLKTDVGKCDCAICYNVVHTWFALPVLCRKNKKKSILILADYSDTESYRSILRKIYARWQRSCIRQFDCVVGLSERVQAYLLKTQQFFLMEGGIDEALYNSFFYQENDDRQEICFMYAGLLSQVTGVDLLLQAFRLRTESNIRLILTGKGPLLSMAEQAVREDGRIILKGNLPYEEYVTELQCADVLINPRNMALPENQNNFPSKIMDYLASGKPIISTKFIGWEKFADNIMFCDCDIESISRCIGEMLNREKNARDIFLKNRKRAEDFEWKRQLLRILG